MPLAARPVVTVPRHPSPSFVFQVGDLVRVRETGTFQLFWPFEEASIARVVGAEARHGWPWYQLHCEDGSTRWFPQLRLLSA